MFLSPTSILDRISVPAGSRVGDFGAGAGHFSLEVARRLGPEVTVYALDGFLPHVESLAREARQLGSRFYALHADLEEPLPLKNNLLTVAIVSNTMYALKNREQFANELARIVEPGGRIVVVDWLGSFKNMGPVREDVVSPGEAAALLQSAGFEIGQSIPAGTHHFAFEATCTTQ